MNLPANPLYILIVICFLFSPIPGKSQQTISYYTNDVNQEEIIDVIRQKDKFEKQAKKLQTRVKEFSEENQFLRNSKERSSKKILRLGRENYRIKDELRANLIKWEKARNSFQEELTILKSQRKKELAKIKILESTINLLKNNISNLKENINELNQQISYYKSIVADLEWENFEKRVELDKTRLLLTQKGCALLLVHKKKKLKINLKDNPTTPKKFSKKTRLEVKAVYYLLADELKHRIGSKINVRFHLYEPGNLGEFYVRTFDIFPVEVDSNFYASHNSVDPTELVSEGILYERYYSIDKSKLKKGIHTYQIIIDASIVVQGSFLIL